jgi:hypothetical protein
MRSRIRTGSVVRDKRDKVWRFYFWENGKRKSRLLGRLPTKAAAWEASKPLRDRLEAKPQNTPIVPTVSTLVEDYKAEKMPDRKTPTEHTNRGFTSTSCRSGAKA